MSVRVAHFTQRYPPALGGSEAYFARLGHYLTRCGDRVTVFTSSALDLEAFWSRAGRCLPSGVTNDGGVRVRRYRLWHCPGRRYLFKALSFVPWRPLQRLAVGCNPICPGMWRDVRRCGAAFDAVHATAFPYTFPIVCGLRLARRLHVPFLLTPFLHLGDPRNPLDRTRRVYTTPALLSLAHAADAVFVQTPGERAALLEDGVSPARVILQGLGVDAAECTGGNRAAVRREWGVAADEVVVGHLANNSEEKGTVDLLRAAEMLWRRGQRFRVILAGPEMPNFRRFWDEFAARLPAHSVRRLGVLSDEQKRDFFAGLDVFALPSRSDSFGLVLLEAWANGLPNLAYRAGGVADLIQDGVDGLLVRCGDVAALAVALARLIDNAELRCRLGQTGQGRTGGEFRWEDKLGLVRDVLAERVLSHLSGRVVVQASRLRSPRAGETPAPRAEPPFGSCRGAGVSPALAKSRRDACTTG